MHRVGARASTDGGGTRRQFAHAIDVLPDDPRARRHRRRRREIDGVEQSRVDGASFASVLRDAGAPETHETQHFEMLGSRGIYHRGWKAVTFHPLGAMYDDGLDPDAPFDDDVWELYDVVADPSETNDLAAAEPERLAAMVELWWEEAARNDVLPLDNRPLFAIMNPRPTTRQARTTYVYYPNGAPVPESVAVNVRNRSHTITATITVPRRRRRRRARCSRSARCSAASRCNSSTAGSATCTTSTARAATSSTATTVVAPGAHRVAFVFTKTAEFTGRGELFVDGEVVGAADIPHFTPMTFSYTGGGLTCGYEVGPAIGDGYDGAVPRQRRHRSRRRRRLRRPAPSIPPPSSTRSCRSSEDACSWRSYRSGRTPS